MRGIVVVVVIIVIFSFPIAVTYNRLVSMREEVREKWAQVEIQLKRRLDLVPHLVSTVEGYAVREREIFEEVTLARSRPMGARTRVEEMERTGQLEDALLRLLRIAEEYPQLNEDESFLRLRQELAGTKSRVDMARIRYNESVRRLNALIKKFPSKVVAGWLGFGEEPYFEIVPRPEKVPELEYPQGGR